MHIVSSVKAPKAPRKSIESFSEEEVIKLAKACRNSYQWHNRPLTETEQHTAEWDLAIVLLLVECGLRNDELCNLKVEDVDWNGNRLQVRIDKGGKDRYVGLGNETRKALHRYLTTRPDRVAKRHSDFLFVNMLRYEGWQMRTDSLGKLLNRIGDMVQAPNCYAHRFRHTAAIRRLKYGINAFQSKEYMGHVQMATTLRYVNASNFDTDLAMPNSSPVDNLRI